MRKLNKPKFTGTFYLAKVAAQRDNRDLSPAGIKAYGDAAAQEHKRSGAIGKWVTSGGFSDDIRDAQIFISMGEVRGRCPMFWAFEIYSFVPSEAGCGTLIKESYGN